MALGGITRCRSWVWPHGSTLGVTLESVGTAAWVIDSSRADFNEQWLTVHAMPMKSWPFLDCIKKTKSR